MKKFLLLLTLTLLMTGCTVVRIDNNIDNVIKLTIEKKSNNLFNTTVEGYKYYLPRSVKIIDNSNYNQTFYNEGNYMYLYVDIISYYYKVNKEYEINKNSFYSKAISYKDKKGYVEVNLINGKYFVEIMYNYAKMESYVTPGKINDAITNMCYILSTIKFNDSVIKNIIVENRVNKAPEMIDIFKARREDSNFLDYIEKNDK